MKLTRLTDPSAVDAALREFDALGRVAFLKKYGFGNARSYFVKRDGVRYDSKAIAGAAVGFQHPGTGALRPSDFSGGEATVAATLRALGYDVERVKDLSPWTGKSPEDLKRDDELSNEDLRAVFKCGNVGGMRRSRRTNTLVIVSDPTKGKYLDKWYGNVLHYCGMGLKGPQSLEETQNKTLAESDKNGVAVHLFEVHVERVYTYVGQVRLSGSSYESQQPDEDGQMRRVWIFPVSPLDGKGAPELPEKALQDVRSRQRKDARKLSDADLAERAGRKSGPASSRCTTTTAFVRDEYVAEYARRRAAGKCELCREPAPFEDKHGNPYLESHHVVWLSRGGPDSIENTAALCPNCHRRMHILDRADDRRRLLITIAAENDGSFQSIHSS
jgi:5-methylcytosine-specific restriction protein A